MPDPSSPLRVVVVGAGTGGRLSITAVQAVPGLELAGMIDRSQDALDKVPWIDRNRVATSTSLGDLAGMEPDVVCVSTWAPSHREVTEAALAARVKGLLVEKPLAATADDARALLAAAEDAGVPVVVPHGLVSMPAPLKVLGLIGADDGIGTLRHVRIACTGWDLINAGIHWLQYAVTALGDDQVTEVRARYDTGTRTFRDGFMVETSGSATATTAQGVTIEVSTGDEIEVDSVTGASIELTGSEGTATYHPWEPAYTLTRDDTSARVEVNSEHTFTGHRHYLTRLRDRVLGRGADDGVARRSLTALDIVRAAYRSSAHDGATVSLPLAEDAPLPVDADAWVPGEPYDPDTMSGGRDGRAL